MRTQQSLHGLRWCSAARGVALVAVLLAMAAGCHSEPAGETADDLTSATATERKISWQSFVYVPKGTPDSDVQKAIQKQVKSAIGALRSPEVAIQDRDALGNVDPKTWVRQDLSVAGATPTAIQRISYKYTDVALAKKKNTATALTLTLLFGDYVAKAQSLKPACSDDQTTAADSLWFHFAPQQAACAAAIRKEGDAINEAAKGLDQGKQISVADYQRNFVTFKAMLEPVKAPPVKYPEYDKLWGFGTDRQKVVVYAFFGVDSDIGNPADVSAVEYFRFIRTLRARFPKLAVTDTQPFSMLLDFDVGGQKLSASYEDVCNWLVDDTGYPAAVGSDPAKRQSLKQQAVQHFGEHWVVWSLPVTVAMGTQTRKMTVEVRTYWGYEDGKPEWREAARNRYLEGFWHADIFLYQGHSHFGHGPLEPTGYVAANFPNRYQSFLINSCVSFNYYDQDFLNMHPGATKNLDIVVNGLPAYWTKMGEATANYVIGLLGGDNRAWVDVLGGMIVKPSWAPTGYDPMRAVNGELDNQFDAKKTPIKLTVL